MKEDAEDSKLDPIAVAATLTLLGAGLLGIAYGSGADQYGSLTLQELSAGRLSPRCGARATKRGRLRRPARRDHRLSPGRRGLAGGAGVDADDDRIRARIRSWLRLGAFSLISWGDRCLARASRLRSGLGGLARTGCRGAGVRPAGAFRPRRVGRRRYCFRDQRGLPPPRALGKSSRRSVRRSFSSRWLVARWPLSCVSL